MKQQFINLDSNALVTIFSSSVELGLFIENLKSRSQISICITTLVFDQIFCGEIKEKVVARFKMLKQMSDAIGEDRIIFIPKFSDVLNSEKKKRGKIKAPLNSSKRSRDILYSYLKAPSLIETLHDEGADYRRDTFENSHGLRDRDKLFREKSKKFNQEELLQMLKSYNGVRSDSKSLEVPHTLLVGRRGPQFSRNELKRFLWDAKPSILKTWLNMGYFRYILNALSFSDVEFDKMRKVDNGNWADVVIASQSAYCDFFVTDDKALLAICEYLRGKGLHKFKTISLKSFSEEPSINQ